MATTHKKRRYRNSLDFIQEGFRVCFVNAQDLLSASTKLLEANLHGPALSLAVLALEEVGKLYAIDGLLFARSEDHKAGMFTKSGKSHAAKLEVLIRLPLFLGHLAKSDPRHGREAQYDQALAISFLQLKQDGNDVLNSLQTKSFSELDKWKQKGFYTEQTDRGFSAPHDTITPSLSSTVHHFAWRAISTLDFILKGGNLDRYIGAARTLRSKMSEEDHQESERKGRAIFAELFCEEGDDG
jgi:AbiV family abortive infection protein